MAPAPTNKALISAIDTGQHVFCKDKAQLAAANAYVENLKQHGKNIITGTRL